VAEGPAFQRSQQQLTGSSQERAAVDKEEFLHPND
jgi:hypothetical protein